MASVKATFTIRNDRSEDHEVTMGDIEDPDEGHPPVSVSEKQRREITARRDLEDAEDAVWAIEASDHEVVWDLWEHVNGEDWDDWGFYSPYPSADVRVELDYKVSVHDVVWHIAQREDAEPPGVYLDLAHSQRVYGEFDGFNLTGRTRALVQYLAALGVDTSYWTHGSEDVTNMDKRRLPDGLLEHAGVETE